MSLKQAPLLFLVISAALMAVAVIPLSALAQEETMDDPLLLGAWLHESNCIRCHGDYEDSRLASDYDEEELIDLIAGGSREGCTIPWTKEFGGPFNDKELEAVILYMLTWEELGAPPDLPDLPPTPTPTIPPSSTPILDEGEAVEPTPTPTPTPGLDPNLQTILDGNNLAYGAYLYTQNCYRCHTSYARGRPGQGVDEDTIKDAIENGKVGTSMIAFSTKAGGNLKFREINAILSYILAWESLGEPPLLPEDVFTPPTPDPAAYKMIPLEEVPPVEGNLFNGQRLYHYHCSGCHGYQGEGGIGNQLAKTWWTVRPDLTIKSTIERGIPNSLMIAWGQNYGGPLHEEEIADLVSVILALSEVK